MNTNTIINISVRISKLEEEVKSYENKADTTGEEFYESKIVLLTQGINDLKLELNRLILNTQKEIEEFPRPKTPVCGCLLEKQ